MNRIRWGLIGASVIAGLLMPRFYDWSGANQSHASPEIPWIALGILILDVFAIVWIVRLPIGEQQTSLSSNWRPFNIRQILIANTITVGFVTAFFLLKVPLGSCLSIVLIGYAVWLTINEPSLRWQIIVLLICMWVPFLWALTWPEFRFNLLSIVLMLSDVPALLAAVWCSMLFGWNLLPDSGIAGVFAAAELAVGLWMIHSGPKQGLVYSLLVFTLALFSSFALQALVRA